MRRVDVFLTKAKDNFLDYADVLAARQQSYQAYFHTICQDSDGYPRAVIETLHGELELVNIELIRFVDPVKK